MKKVMYVFAIVATGLMFTNCGSDDDNDGGGDTADCTTTNWFGSYNRVDCGSDSIFLEITQDGTQMLISLDIGSSILQASTSFDRCTVNVGSGSEPVDLVLSGNNVIVNSTRLSGCNNTITLMK